MAGDPEFVLQWFFHNETVPLERTHLTAEEAVDMALIIAKRDAAKRGHIRRVIVLDGLYNIVFEWLFGQGIIKPASLEQ